MDKRYNKHLFFIKKKHANFDILSKELQYKIIKDYAMGVDKPANKRQDMARLIHNKTLTAYELLGLAVGVTLL